MLDPAERLCELLDGRNESVDLARAALILANLEYPELEFEPYEKILDDYADAVGSLIEGEVVPARVVAALAEYLSGKCNYRGNARDYYDPRNSFLSDVIDRRTGIPITLSVIYLSVARRLDLPLYGVSLPGHFIVKFDDGTNIRYIDPFNGGRVLDRSGCEQIARSATGRDIRLSPEHFSAATNRSIILRMLYNLRGIYSQNRQYRKGVGVADMLIRLAPGNGYEYRNRAGLLLQLGEGALARADLETYLALSPDAPDAKEVKQAIAGIRRSQAMMN